MLRNLKNFFHSFNSMLKVGDIVEVESNNIEIEWVYKPDTIIVLDIVELGSNWVVAKINGTYMHSDGNISSHILIEHLTIDLIKTRELSIDQILGSD